MWDYVVGYQKSSFCDWPGRVAPVIFVKGCNLRCPTCHNKNFAYLEKDVLPFSKEIILKDIEEKRDWYGGVVFSGGEITNVPDIVYELYKVKKEFRLPIKIDTNGLLPFALDNLLYFVDFMAVDIKAPWEKYPQVTGMVGTGIDAEFVEKKFNRVFELAKAYPDKFQFRTTMVPLLTEEDLETIQSYLPAGFELIKQTYVERK